jgi:hypothetical protein
MMLISSSTILSDYKSGMSVLSSDRSSYAFTNLLDGIDFYSSTTLMHRNSIPQTVDLCNNVALGLVMVADTYVVVGGSSGTIWMYNQKTGGVVACLQSPTSTCRSAPITSRNIFLKLFPSDSNHSSGDGALSIAISRLFEH